VIEGDVAIELQANLGLSVPQIGQIYAFKKNRQVVLILIFVLKIRKFTRKKPLILWYLT
jgi:hypothetical protein